MAETQKSLAAHLEEIAGEFIKIGTAPESGSYLGLESIISIIRSAMSLQR